MTPYPYCEHGVYVGGCGADHMCFGCEMGIEPTERQLAAYRRDVDQWNRSNRERQLWSLPPHILDGP